MIGELMHLRSRSTYLIASALVSLFVFAGGMYWLSGQPDQYESRALVGFFPFVGNRGLIPGSETVVLAANNYLSLVESSTTVQKAAQDAEIDADILDDGLSTTVTPGSATLAISVTTGDAEQSAAAANAIADNLLAAAADNRTVEAQLLSPATAPENSSGPPRTLLTGLILLFSAGLFIVLWQLESLLAWSKEDPRGDTAASAAATVDR